MTKTAYTSGQISLVAGTVIYRINDGGWSLPLSDIRLIAEYTTANGPFVDDYFFVFLTRPDDGWYEASFYAEGRDAFLTALSQTLGIPVKPGLCNSTHWKTRILWPAQLRDRPLTRTVPQPTRWGRFWAQITGKQDVVLTDIALSVFKNDQGAEQHDGGDD